MRKGTYDEISRVMAEHGFRIRKGTLESGLALQIRLMLCDTYRHAYSNGFMAGKKQSKK